MQRRLFFALPAQVLKQELQRCQKELKAEGHNKPVKADNFHLTLHFLGMQDDSLLPALYQVAAEVVSEPFQLQLNQYGLFRHARCLWLGPSHPPVALQALFSHLGDKLKALGLEIASSYKPHITLFRNAHTSAQGIAPILELTVSEFILYESCSTPEGVIYTPLRRWTLGDHSTHEKPY